MIVPAALAALLLVLGAVELAQRGEKLTGTSSVPLKEPVVQVLKGETACQRGLVMPAGSGLLRAYVSVVQPGRRAGLSVTLSDAAGRRLAGGTARLRGGIAEFTLPEVRRSLTNVTACFENTGRSILSIAGIRSAYGSVAVDGELQPAALTVLWYAPGRPSWFAVLADIPSRVGNARLASVWPFWVALACLLGAALAGAVALNRPERR